MALENHQYSGLHRVGPGIVGIQETCWCKKHQKHPKTGFKRKVVQNLATKQTKDINHKTTTKYRNGCERIKSLESWRPSKLGDIYCGLLDCSLVATSILCPGLNINDVILHLRNFKHLFLRKKDVKISQFLPIHCWKLPSLKSTFCKTWR